MLGGCFLIAIRDMLFIAALQIQCHDLQVSNSWSKAVGESEKNTFLSIESCLMETDNNTVTSTQPSIKGLLTRRRFHLKMTSDGSHKGCELSISSLPSDESKDLESDNSCLQVLNLSVLFPQNAARLLKFNEKLAYLWPGRNISDAQKIIGSSFWAVGDSGRTCALTFGGSEDRAWPSCSGLLVYVHFPFASLQTNRLGYIQSRCNHEELDITCGNNSDTQHQKKRVANESFLVFAFEGGSKDIKGKLFSRVRRRHILFGPVGSSIRTVGELTTTPSPAIPLCTLSSLIRLIFRHVRNPNISSINPSLVRRISCAQFLGVSFCQAQGYCMKCGCILIEKEQTISTKNGIGSQVDLNEMNFWHLPHPEEDQLADNVSTTGNDRCNHPPHINGSSLLCPNKCPISFFGVKWECSGVVDDGSAQATLYADGDAALTLLGMSADDIRCIEEAVWSIPGGRLMFKKSVPPSRKLRNLVAKIIAMSANLIAEPMRLIPISFRGEYVLETHCRNSSRPRRPLDYYVRCKPLSEHARYLNHTEIDSFFSEGANHDKDSFFEGEVASYSLLPLKLELVDCGQPSFEVSEQNLTK
jgi:hypothetical protein